MQLEDSLSISWKSHCRGRKKHWWQKAHNLLCQRSHQTSEHVHVPKVRHKKQSVWPAAVLYDWFHAKLLALGDLPSVCRRSESLGVNGPSHCPLGQTRAIHRERGPRSAVYAQSIAVSLSHQTHRWPLNTHRASLMKKSSGQRRSLTLDAQSFIQKSNEANTAELMKCTFSLLFIEHLWYMRVFRRLTTSATQQILYFPVTSAHSVLCYSAFTIYYESLPTEYLAIDCYIK